MEHFILWGSLFIAVILLFISFRFFPFKDWFIIFLLTSYVSVISGTVVVEEGMLSYPVKLLEKHFDSSLQFEMVILPVICLYFCYTTYNSKITGIFFQGFLYTSALTLVEVLLETYTDVIEYHTWTWLFTFMSVFILLLFIRASIELINSKTQQK